MTTFGESLVAWAATYALHSTLLFGLAAVAVLVAARAHASPRFAEGVWRSALAAAFVTATWQNTSQHALWSWSLPAARAGVAALEPAPEACGAALAQGTGAPGGGPTLAPPGADAEPQSAGSIAPRWPFAVLGLWALGALAGLARLAGTGWLLARRLRDRSPVPAGPVRAELERLLADSPLEEVRLTQTSALRAPASLGWRRPEIVVPERALAELELDDWRPLFAHELAHLERKDPLWFAGLSMLSAVFFFQPLLAFARERLAAAAEALCDERAVLRTGRPLDLARCLTRVASWLVRAPEPWPIPRMAAQGSQLAGRVARLVGDTRPSEGRRWPAACAGLALLGAGFAAPAVSPAAAPRASEPACAAPAPACPLEALDGLATCIERLREDARALALEVERAGLTERHGAALAEIDERLCALHGRCSGLRNSLAAAPSTGLLPRIETTGTPE